MRIAKVVKGAYCIHIQGIFNGRMSFDQEKNSTSWPMPKDVCYEMTVNFIIAQNNRAAPQGLALEMLEPYDGKLSRTVLRGPGVDNYPRLPDLSE